MKHLVLPSLLVLVTALAGCAGVDPSPLPETRPVDAYKEASGPWIAASEDAEPLRPTAWWKRFEDPDLDRLQDQLLADSPDLAAALARYQQARAATDAVRSAQYPTLGLGASATRNRQSDRRPLRGASSPDIYNNGLIGLNLDYEIDLWGRVSQQVKAGAAREHAAKADLAGAQLSLQTQLADTLLSLRGADREIALLTNTEQAYSKAATMIAERHRAGLSSGLDLARAENQRDSARSQLQQMQGQRALLEHAIAAQVGVPASQFSLAPRIMPELVPAVPLGLPSTLLERRPDIVSAQQRVAAANASVGVARTAFFPAITLGALLGYQSDVFSNVIAAPNMFWTIGPALAVNLLDGGRRQAEVARAKASLDEAGQTYRSVVLQAFTQVEDQLALLNSFGQAASSEQSAVAAATRALELANNRYKDGAASYLDVVTAQTAALQAERNALSLTTRQRRATVQLVRALGGGWSDDS
ncbi:efflux transporter outer membrane subunit [Cupriavidus metallidurans]|uniref:efflux transporter outer membrane subunit n=1 Tax=Cupriavidus metallidurans TaxID=119219 RepID=UPI00055AC2CC|nr:efflux transporter outer membrane subunit [Cupriavidus metallidurans]